MHRGENVRNQTTCDRQVNNFNLFFVGRCDSLTNICDDDDGQPITNSFLFHFAWANWMLCVSACAYNPPYKMMFTILPERYKQICALAIHRKCDSPPFNRKWLNWVQIFAIETPLTTGFAFEHHFIWPVIYTYSDVSGLWRMQMIMFQMVLHHFCIHLHAERCINCPH